MREEQKPEMTRTAPAPENRLSRAVVPASTANLGPGFDSLGMALSLYEGISMRRAGRTVIHLFGEHLEGVPTDKTNLVYTTAQAVFAKAGVEIPELEIAIESQIPLTRGLGSSASAIVGALAAANGLAGGPLSEDELFQMAAAMERHPDNVGAALFGGFVAAAWDGERADAVRIEPPAELEVLVAIPEFELSTKKARNVLPERVSMEDAVFNLSHSSLLTAALATGKLEVLRRAMRDRLHQSYRASMIPGMTAVLEGAPDHGALGAVLSGAGPTLLMPVDRTDARRHQLEGFVKSALAAEGTGVSLRWLKPDLGGTVTTWEEDDGGAMKPPLSGAVTVRPEVKA